MLRTYLLTFTALDTVGSFTVLAAGDDVVVIVPGVPVVECLMGILCGKQIRDADPLWT